MSLAISDEVKIALLAKLNAIVSHILIDSLLPYLIPSLINISAIPITPSPICLQSCTVCLWISSGCKGKPSNNTSFNPLTAIPTIFLNSSWSNVAFGVNGFLTNSAKLIEPNRQLPPFGRGSSAHGLTPA